MPHRDEASLNSHFMSVGAVDNRVLFESGISCHDALVHEHFIRPCRGFGQDVHRLLHTFDPQNTHIKRLREFSEKTADTD